MNEPDSKKIKLMNPYVQLNKAFLVNSLPGIAKQFNNEETADVKVLLGITEHDNENKATLTLYLHKIVLSSSSPMFATWLNKYADNETVSILKIPEKEYWMSNFFRYFYTGQLMMTSENIVDIYIIADKYLVESLKCHCEDNIKENLKIKIDKLSCTHRTSQLNQLEAEDEQNLGRSSPCSNSDHQFNNLFHPYQSFLRSRCAINTANNVNIFSNLNSYPQAKPTISIPSHTIGSSSSSTRCSNNLSSSQNTSSINSTLFNSNLHQFTIGSKNPFSRSMFDSYSNPNLDIDTINNRFDGFCDKCIHMTVSHVLTFDTIVRLTQITHNNDLRKLALYNLMIRLAQELPTENYSNFVQLPFALLLELLEDDNFFCPEYHLFCATKQWLESTSPDTLSSASSNSDSSSNDQEPLKLSQADQLFDLIRLPLMSRNQLYDVDHLCHSSQSPFSRDRVDNQFTRTLRFIVYHNVNKAKLDNTVKDVTNSCFARPRIPNDILNLFCRDLNV